MATTLYVHCTVYTPILKFTPLLPPCVYIPVQKITLRLPCCVSAPVLKITPLLPTCVYIPFLKNISRLPHCEWAPVLKITPLLPHCVYYTPALKLSLFYHVVCIPFFEDYPIVTTLRVQCTPLFWRLPRCVYAPVLKTTLLLPHFVRPCYNDHHVVTPLGGTPPPPPTFSFYGSLDTTFINRIHPFLSNMLQASVSGGLDTDPSLHKKNVSRWTNSVSGSDIDIESMRYTIFSSFCLFFLLLHF